MIYRFATIVIAINYSSLLYGYNNNNNNNDTNVMCVIILLPFFFIIIITTTHGEWRFGIPPLALCVLIECAHKRRFTLIIRARVQRYYACHNTTKGAARCIIKRRIGIIIIFRTSESYFFTGRRQCLILNYEIRERVWYLYTPK